MRADVIVIKDGYLELYGDGGASATIGLASPDIHERVVQIIRSINEQAAGNNLAAYQAGKEEAFELSAKILMDHAAAHWKNDREDAAAILKSAAKQIKQLGEIL